METLHKTKRRNRIPLTMVLLPSLSCTILDKKLSWSSCEFSSKLFGVNLGWLAIWELNGGFAFYVCSKTHQPSCTTQRIKCCSCSSTEDLKPFPSHRALWPHLCFPETWAQLDRGQNLIHEQQVCSSCLLEMDLYSWFSTPSFDIFALVRMPWKNKFPLALMGSRGGTRRASGKADAEASAALFATGVWLPPLYLACTETNQNSGTCATLSS